MNTTDDFNPGDYVLSFQTSWIVRPVGAYCRSVQDMHDDAKRRATGIGETAHVVRRSDYRVVFTAHPEP